MQKLLVDPRAPAARIALPAVLATVLVLASSFTSAQERAEHLFNVVNLSAQVEREVANDTIVAMLAVEVEGNDPAALAESVNRSMRDALKLAQGYRSVKTRSGNYQTTPVYDKTRIVRWRVRQELRLESTDFAAATELTGKLQSSLVVTRMTVGLSPELRRQTENALISEAMAAFNERAAIARDSLKAKGYRMKELQVSTGGGHAPRMYAASAAMRAESAPAPAVEAGTSQIQVSVNGSVQLLP